MASQSQLEGRILGPMPGQNVKEELSVKLNTDDDTVDDTDNKPDDKLGDNPEGRPMAPPDQFQEMMVGGGSFGFKTPPVHETMTLAALLASNYPKYIYIPSTITYENAIKDGHYHILEILRGIVWNDDPANLLFNDAFWCKGQNFNRSSGLSWGTNFKEADWGLNSDCTKDSWFGGGQNIIGRSHFGDLQFLHAMAEKEKERAEVTRDKIMIWLEIMYKVATDSISWNTKLRDIELPAYNGEQRRPLARLFTNRTLPRGDDSIRTLLTSDHSWSEPIVQCRALGSCMHLIQDSYARGHCHREVVSRNSTPTRYGGVMAFHTYVDQDKEKHKHYDFADKDMGSVNCADINQFREMDGCTDAINHCTTLINFAVFRKPWEGEVKQWLMDKVFFFASGIHDANKEVH